MITVHKPHGAIVGYLKGKLGQPIWNEKELFSLKSVKEFRKMFIKSSHKYFDSSMYTLKNYAVHQIVKDIQVFETLSVLDHSPYEQFNVDITKEFKKLCREVKHN